MRPIRIVYRLAIGVEARGSWRVPHIWLSYPELAAFLGCANDEARPAAIRACLPRRRCRDGATRVKLTPDDTERYLRSCAHISAQTDIMVASLNAVVAQGRHAQERPRSALARFGMGLLSRGRA